MNPKPEIAVGSPERVRATDHVRQCWRCLKPVYMRDQQAADAPEHYCTPCFIAWMEERPDDEKFALMLPPGVSPRSFVAFLKGEIPSPFLS